MARLPGTGPDSALARTAQRLSGGRLTPRGLRFASLSLGMVAILGLVAALLAVQATSTPNFCGSCHLMKPYYESWKNSKHSRIACVECHISPGITAEFRKKYEALSMVAKYFTGTYGTKPWAEVDDAACLRCHERRLLQGKEPFHNVIFDHTPHLTEARRGLHLRCTSCHSQIVQGSHITVTSSTCALCHFKDQPLNEGTGRCLTCHQVPQRVMTAAGTTFDHSQVRTLDMDCRSCHAGIVQGDGAVPRERCLTCHNQPARLAEYDDRDLLHRKHVTEHKVDCETCHLVIQHGRPEKSAPPPEAIAGGSCETCHGSGHSPQQDLYAGRGGRGVPDMPSPMYLAGVTCQGCHNPELTVLPASSGPVGPHSIRAGAVSCMSCHGPEYDRIYLSWKQGVSERVTALRRQLETSVGAMGLDPPQAWKDARRNYDLVELGHGVHNLSYAYALLEKTHEQMNQARRERGLAPLTRPWTVVGGSRCLNCHAGIERQSGAFAGRQFSHGPHLLRAQLDCEKCHKPHEERTPAEVVRFGRNGCLTCHHQQAAAQESYCLKCHADVKQGTVQSARGEFSHQAHLEQGLECGTCHQPKAGDPRTTKGTCLQCHED